jgi:hypothetical protein
MIAVDAMQGVTVCLVLAATALTWRVAMSAHDKIDWLKEDMDDRESAMSLIVNQMGDQLVALTSKVERLTEKLQTKTLDAARTRVRKIGGAR